MPGYRKRCRKGTKTFKKTSAVTNFGKSLTDENWGKKKGKKLAPPKLKQVQTLLTFPSCQILIGFLVMHESSKDQAVES